MSEVCRQSLLHLSSPTGKKPMNEKTLVHKIVEWIQDEAAKELPDGYICIIGGEDEKVAREIVVKERFILRQRLNAPEFLLRFGFIRSYLEHRATKKGKVFFEEMVGECLLEEQDDVDAILLYPDRLLRFYKEFVQEDASAKIDIDELENVARGFARHECRHACQFTELRKMDVDPSLVLEWEFSAFDYGKGPLETDAFLYQFHVTEQSVDEVCREIISKASI